MAKYNTMVINGWTIVIIMVIIIIVVLWLKWVIHIEILNSKGEVSNLRTKMGMKSIDLEIK